jgi:OTU domain-containing protein 6
MDKLLKEHAANVAFVENQIRQLSKPKLGRKPLSVDEVAATAAQLRAEVMAKHVAALANFQEEPPVPADVAAAAEPPTVVASDAAEAGGDGEGEEEPSGSAGGAGSAGGKLTRRQRKQLKVQEEEAAASARDAGKGVVVVDKKAVELAALARKLNPLSFGIHPVPADGSCLFYAVEDQLSGILGWRQEHSMLALRKRAADYLRSHWVEFAAFLPYEAGDGYEGDERRAVRLYAARLESTSAWGGHPELRALACTLGLPIIVYQAEGEPWHFLPDGEQEGRRETAGAGRDTALRLSFHRHYLSMGEHYNSVRRKSVM